jgi:hypothetical protein
MGAGLGGLVHLVNLCLTSEANSRQRMGARLDALGALEQGRGLGRAEVQAVEGSLEARATWLEGERVGEVRLRRWSGPAHP